MPSLRYVEAGEPGYTRRKRGKGWQYLTVDGKTLRNARTIARLESTALPPAYTDVWYARDAQAHIQATGIDARGRKQYRYHPEFRAAREEQKFGRCGDFGRALSAIRKAVESELSRRTLCRDKVIAAVVRLLDVAKVRVGNEAYARANKSFGATTLRGRHVQIDGRKLRLDYVGKSGIRHKIGISDAKLAGFVRKLQDMPGQLLFQYKDTAGNLCPVTSGDVNDWLRSHGGQDFTAKHFRTWGASVIAFELLCAARGRTRLKSLLLDVSDRLGNTPAVARKSYVHPAIFDAVLDPVEREWRLPSPTKWLSGAEKGLIAFLDERCTDDDAQLNGE